MARDPPDDDLGQSLASEGRDLRIPSIARHPSTSDSTSSTNALATAEVTG